MYKFLHDILPNNKRLYEMQMKNSPNCNYCQNEDTNIHKFYNCYKINKAVKWIKNCIEYMSNMRFQSIVNLLYLELPRVQRRTKNVLCIIICNFITCIWNNRDNLDFIEDKIIIKVWNERNFLMKLLKGKEKEILCKRYCEVSFEKLNSLRVP